MLLEDLKPLLSEPKTQVGFEMTRGIVRGLIKLCLLSWESLMKYFYKLMGVPFNHRMNTFTKRFSYGSLKYLTGTLLKYSFFHWLIGSLIKWNIHKQHYNRKLTEQEYKQKYKNIKYIENCPFSFNARLDE